jgi:amino acid adenylation domain-containing protein
LVLDTAPHTPVRELEVLPAEERRLLLETWNATEAKYPEDLCIHELFEEQVEKTPGATAVEYGEQSLSYAELNQHANQLGHYLIGLGVKPEERVAICVERGVGMVVALLGILKAGGAYVPLDPGYPDKRLAYMLEDTQAAFVLTEAKLEEKLTGLLPVATRLITLDRQWDEISERVAELKTQNVKLRLNSHHLAYVIYTSGSTGLSKGVMVEHRSVVNLFFGLKNSIYSADKTDVRVSVNGPLTFDTSVKQVIQLLAGHVLDIVPESVRHDTEALLRFIHERKIEVFDCTPSQLRLLLEAGLARERSDGSKWGESLQCVLVGGEHIDESMWTMLAESGIRFFNVYGPTECTVDATIGAVGREDKVPHIGRPIANTKIYLLDEKQRPVPLGAVGEIYIGGAGVARGYLKRPERTAERFLRDPFTTAGDGRMYRTGDLARYLPDGRIEFLGRNDHQVKIRGFRIELGEIEARLAEHEWVREAVVVAREDEKGEKRLVGYVVVVNGMVEDGELRAYLAERLPEYMVPAAFVQLEALPLTPNGKLDRKALPEPGEAYTQRIYEPPQGEIEEQLAGMWQELLGVERVGRQDHFFEMGGHSLLAMRLVVRVRQVLGVELPVTTLFARPMLAQLAEAVREAGAEGKQEELPAMVPISRSGPMPLSFAQQRLWFLAQMEGVSVTYHIPAALRLRGELDREALKRSLDAIWARHEGLRSVFVVEEGEPRVELLLAERGMPLLEHDLREVVDAHEELQRLMVEEANAGFDLAQGPLIRAHLVRMQEEEHVLLLTQHHIVSDAWSMGVLARELGVLYGAFHRQQPSPLPDLPVQYADYAAWQREWLRGERLQKQSEYWREALADAPVLLELPTDRPRPLQQSFTGGCVPIRMDRDLTRRLRELSHGHGTTLYMTLLGAWAAVLSRLSGQAEVVIGTPVANRRRAETEGLIGFFVNTLALRIDLTGEPSVAEMLKRVRNVVLGAQEHQDVPFEQVVEMVQPPRQLNYTPVFQVMLSWQNQERMIPDLPGVQVSLTDLAYDVAKFDLQLNLAEEEEMIIGTLRYGTALFDEGTMRRQAGYLMTMAQAMAADQKQEVAAIDLLEEEERKLLLETWNATETSYPGHLCVHQLVEQQAERNPEAVAVVCGDQRFSYAELNKEANRLAHHLINLGVKPRDPVAICVERGAGMVVGLLGILKAGGAYVPLDPAYPSRRLREILDDVGPRLLLSDAAGLEALGWDILPELMVVDLERAAQSEALPPVWSEQPAVNPDAQALGLTSHDLAYVMYTSGSTGTPKGVMVPHRAITRLALGSNFIRFSPEEVFLQLAPVSFDAATFEIWGPLLNGAKLALVAGNKVSPEEIGEAIRKYGVTTMWLTAAFFHFIADEHLYQLAPLRQLLAGGDVLSVRHVRKVLEAMPYLRLVNGYGPTENTTFTCCHTITLDSLERGSVPIGRPISNTKVYILDNHLRPAPLGAVGELYAGGSGVACGYLNRPDLTAERFLADPFDGGHGRMYRTGDLARYLPDGSIEFLGRNDHQVKIRGFRIELGEIEARLAEHELVQESVVVAREDGDGEKRLVGYAVAREETDAGELAAILRTHLAGILPEYMVPVAFVQLEALPLTPNGKLDRKALPEPEGEAYAQHGYEEPQGEIEEQLARMWQELLGVERVGRQDRFFELGGHSLLAMRLVARVRQVLGVELPVTTLFARPQLAQLAEAVKEAGREGKPEALEAMVAISRQGAMPLSFAQQRLWFLAQMEGVSVTYHIPVALRLRGELDREALKRSLDAIWARHEGLRSVFVVVEGEPRVELLPAERGMPLLEHDLRGVVDASERLQRLMAEEANAGFDLAQGPLIRAHLVRMEEEEHVLALTQHHIVSDGWSMGILVREVTELYQAYVEGREPQLAEMKIQYGDYAVWQRKWLRGEILEEQLMYWREQLAGVEMLELTTDRVRPEVVSHRGELVKFELGEELSEDLREISRHEGVTMFMTLLAGFQVLLGLWTGQEDIVVGTDVANRSRPETQGLIGFFVNQLVLRTDLRGGPTFREVLRRVREMTLGAYAHQDVPFEKLVQDIGAYRDIDRNPFFEVKFVLQNEMETIMFPGLTITPLSDSADSRLAKLDMTLFMEERQRSLSGILEYRTSKFTHGRMLDFAEQYQRLLRQASDAMDTEIHLLSAVSLAESSILSSFQQAPK